MQSKLVAQLVQAIYFSGLLMPLLAILMFWSLFRPLPGHTPCHPKMFWPLFFGLCLVPPLPFSMSLIILVTDRTLLLFLLQWIIHKPPSLSRNFLAKLGQVHSVDAAYIVWNIKHVRKYQAEYWNPSPINLVKRQSHDFLKKMSVRDPHLWSIDLTVTDGCEGCLSATTLINRAPARSFPSLGSWKTLLASENYKDKDKDNDNLLPWFWKLLCQRWTMVSFW